MFSLGSRQIMDLATLGFVERKQWLILAGSSGTGKSHIAKALLLMGCQQSYRCRYVTATDMLRDLLSGLADDSLDEKLKAYVRPQVLLIDEIGFDRLEPLGCIGPAPALADLAQVLLVVLLGFAQAVDVLVGPELPAMGLSCREAQLRPRHQRVGLLEGFGGSAETAHLVGPGARLEEVLGLGHGIGAGRGCRGGLPVGQVVDVRISDERDSAEAQKSAAEENRSEVENLLDFMLTDLFRDPLTGLPSRALFHERVGRAVTRRCRFRFRTLLPSRYSPSVLI